MDPPGWAIHLPPGNDPDDLTLVDAPTLPDAWARRWTALGDRRQVHDESTCASRHDHGQPCVNSVNRRTTRSRSAMVEGFNRRATC